MIQRRIPSHPIFKLEGRSRHFQSFWELELTPGEETCPHQHYESEELIYLVQGEGRVRIAEEERRVTPGVVVLVPPRTDHVIANRSDHLLKAITVESRLDLVTPPEEPAQLETLEELQASAAEIRAEESAATSLRAIEATLEGLPAQVDEAVAIKTIVELFDIGGKLAEQIEEELGLDNAGGRQALLKVERRIMAAVVEVSGRYSAPGRLWG